MESRSRVTRSAPKCFSGTRRKRMGMLGQSRRACRQWCAAAHARPLHAHACPLHEVLRLTHLSSAKRAVAEGSWHDGEIQRRPLLRGASGAQHHHVPVGSRGGHSPVGVGGTSAKGWRTRCRTHACRTRHRMGDRHSREDEVAHAHGCRRRACLAACRCRRWSIRRAGLWVTCVRL